MSVLETFYILFKGDTSDLKKSSKEAESALASLTKSAVGFFAASAAAYKTFNSVLSASNFANELGNTSKALGVNAQDLDAWGLAVQRTGGTAAGFQQSLRNLSQHFGASANVSLKILPQLADAFARIGTFRARQYGKILGLDESTILLLQQGRREVESIINRQKELGVVSDKDIEISNRYKIANLELSLAFRGLYLALGQEIIPALTKVYNVFVPVVEYLRRHKDFVIGALIGISVAAAAISIAIAPITVFTASLVALIGVFALLYEDLQAYAKGNQSFIGDLITRWSKLKNVIHDAISGVFKLLEHAFSPIFTAIKAVEYLFSLFNGRSISIGTNLLDTVSSSPVAALSSGGMFTNQAFSRNSSINTGNIIINTQATDANGISKSFMDNLNRHYWQSNNQAADGMSI